MKIGIFGLGYVGFSTICWFSKAGIQCLGTDIDEKKVELINNRILPVQGIEPVLPEGLCDFELVEATTDWRKLVDDEEIEAFFIAVPTEKNGEPWWDPLIDIVGKLSQCKHEPLIIIESTMAVGIVDKLVIPHLRNVAVCPRRDWFTQPGKNLKTLPRIVGGVTESATKKAVDILSTVCDTLIPCTYQEAELTKCYENLYRFLACVLAQEMALAYPNIDIRKVLELGGTKWNVEVMYPNVFGTSGYCIPLAPKYVLSGAEKPDELVLVRDAIHRDDSITEIFRGLKGKKVGILGLAYMGNIKVHILSSAIRFLKIIGNDNIEIHDPLYTEDEIMKITGCRTFKFPDDLNKFEVILLLAGHDEYKNISEKELVERSAWCEFIFDNVGIWENVRFACPYYFSGRAGWMNALC